MPKINIKYTLHIWTTNYQSIPLNCATLDICWFTISTNPIFVFLCLSGFGASCGHAGKRETLKHRHKSHPVVVVHPAVQDGVDECWAHCYDMEHSEKQLEVLHVRHAAVDVNGQLEGVERQPADGKDHHHGQEHLGGLLPSLITVISIVSMSHVILQFIPDANVSDRVDY